MVAPDPPCSKLVDNRGGAGLAAYSNMVSLDATPGLEFHGVSGHSLEVHVQYCNDPEESFTCGVCVVAYARERASRGIVLVTLGMLQGCAHSA